MVFAIKIIDRYAGNLICNFISLFNKKKPAAGIKTDKILVIQLWGIGETILTLPAIKALRKKFPDAEINVLATPRNKDVFYKNGDISQVIEVRLNPASILGFIIKNIKKYDLAVDMEEYLNISAIISFFAGRKTVGYSHNSRARLYSNKIRYNDKQHASQTFLDLVMPLGIDYGFDRLPKLNFSKNDRNFVEVFLKENGVRRGDFVVCAAPGAAESAKARMWPYDRYAELCDEIIAKYNAKIVFAGTLDENELIASIQDKMENKGKAINAAGKMTLNQLFCLIGKCNLFIGNDAGPMHIAAAQGVKTLGLFGPNLPVRFGPYGKGNIGLYKGYNCEFSPCINVHRGQVPDCVYQKNSNEYQKCMKNISVDDVLKEVEKMV
ncbi:glycosyltransferase family 9 protein [Candidatus Woesearchaeota archaeon]|nr:glycosyltransferase family 9 protein [Candidatus Woesearchaeota archaeon]